MLDKKIKAIRSNVDKSLSTYPKHVENPFMQQLLYMRNTRNKIVAAGGSLSVFDTEAGENHENRTLRSWVVERVDTEEFTKIYSNVTQRSTAYCNFKISD